jgi:anti-sigma factor RsiW
MRLFNFDDPAHRDTVALLPWYVNGTLDGVERARVEQHVRECVACHGELEAQRNLRQLVRMQDAPPALSSALARMHARLDRPSLRLRPIPGLLERAAKRLQPRWLAWVALAQAACIVALLSMPGVRDEGRFHTLSARPTAPAVTDAVVVVFDGATPEARIQSLLRALDARIVDGPNTRGAYTLEVPAGRQPAVLRALEHEPDVLFVQPAPGSQARSG